MSIHPAIHERLGACKVEWLRKRLDHAPESKRESLLAASEVEALVANRPAHLGARIRGLCAALGHRRVKGAVAA